MAGVVEGDGTEHVAVIGDGDGLHAELAHLVTSSSMWLAPSRRLYSV
jgi:hypothetical protein